MQVAFQPADALAEDVWEVSATPEERRLLGATGDAEGATSIVVLREPPVFADSRLEFPHTGATVLRHARGTRTLVLYEGPSETLPADEAAPRLRREEWFYATLPPALQELGCGLLSRVRQFSSRVLQLSESGRFVERPDNFWTVKIQPRDVSLRITVRGVPEELPKAGSLQIGPDRNGYSTFKLADLDQLDDAVQVIRFASERRRR